MNSLLKHTASCVLLLGLTHSCAMAPGGLAASTTPIEGRAYQNLGAVSATDSRVYLLGLIPISGENSIRDAIEDAKKQKEGDALIEVSVESYSQWWVLFTRYVTRVDGKAIRFLNPEENTLKDGPALAE